MEVAVSIDDQNPGASRAPRVDDLVTRVFVVGRVWGISSVVSGWTSCRGTVGVVVVGGEKVGAMMEVIGGDAGGWSTKIVVGGVVSVCCCGVGGETSVDCGGGIECKVGGGAGSGVGDWCCDKVV